MAGIRVRRHLVANAILKARDTDKGRSVVIIDVLEGISVDSTILIIRSIEKIRDRQEDETGYRPVGNDLRCLVEKVAWHTGFDSGRQRAYVLVIMRYYLFLRNYTQKIKDFRSKPRVARPTVRHQASPLMLVG